MDIRDRIIEATRQVYARHGFRGATTRLIAAEAGVNEVTLFRLFGSKAALVEAVMQLHVAQSPVPALPDEPVDPEVEVTRWADAVLTHMRANRSLLRTAIGELEERRDAAVSMCEGPNCAGMVLTDYMLRLQTTGRADAGADIPTSVAMLMSSLFGDALCRDIIPTTFPEPVEEAPRRYVQAFLRSLGVTAERMRAPRPMARRRRAG
jgi:AcrR family transcriptional regulator